MAGITITDVKIVGLCSKCRKKHTNEEVPRWENGEIIVDEDISCTNGALGDSECSQSKSSENNRKAKQ